MLRDEELPDPEVERALVRGLLLHKFGTDVSNDARFQAIVKDVLAMIRRDVTASRLLNLAIRQLANADGGLSHAQRCADGRPLKMP